MQRIFIASSSDLEDERKEFRLFLYDEGFQPVVWENIDHSITTQEFQDRINQDHLHTSDIVIFMVKSRLGKFTKEEFDEAYNKLGQTVQKIYVYFFDCKKSEINRENFNKIEDLKDFLKKEKKFYVEIENFEQLKNHFNEQKNILIKKKKP